ncbi:hypothetical protein FQN52_007737 [Onygenales sp. PD_12]|nr:hypothetical protein FQN53_002551 [Emmonsiellopsis sp. PD_33]KAK2786729.1 hypothetical protein FQN52_007737 [Onygenales sp. PD_12]KAK2787689.1 hypothetical protein FQN51_003100 [Onygenales sp. PD_10]
MASPANSSPREHCSHRRIGLDDCEEGNMLPFPVSLQLSQTSTGQLRNIILRLATNSCDFYCSAGGRAFAPGYLCSQGTSRAGQKARLSTIRRVPQYRDMAPKAKEGGKVDRSIPRPSSSVILVSPQNEVLLLHRVKTSASFPSAHVFPGGNISSQDGENFPPAGHPDSHDEGPHYRRAAIRELFEESGILLAKDKVTGQMIHVNAEQREAGRHAIHRNEISFMQWLKSINEAAEPDIDPLLPFSHWITPATNPRRFTTQMYLYFLPLSPESNSIISEGVPGNGEGEVQVPTSDGGLEITEARFLPPSEWLRLAKKGDVIMFPPQVLLLTFVSQFLERVGEYASTVSKEESAKRRAELVSFVHSGSPPWKDKYISPKPIGQVPDGRVILTLDYVGPELQGSDKKGEPDRVVLVRFLKEGPREVEIRWRSEILKEEKHAKSAL